MIKKSDVSGYLAFFKVPKPLIYDSKYKKLSNNAKLMYMLLFDRLELSLVNKWHDKEGNVFQYYTNEQLMIDLNCSEPTIIKTKKELKDAQLLKEVRQGVNMPNRIYINVVNGSIESLNEDLKKIKSGTENSLVQELKNVQGIKTDNINTDKNNIMSICSEVIQYLNQVAGKKYKPDTPSHQKYIKARLKEGYKLDDFKYVVDVMTAKWTGTDFQQYLQPQTLFGNKFDNYLNQQMPKQQNVQKQDERLGF